jgi:hypothetical protein
MKIGDQSIRGYLAMTLVTEDCYQFRVSPRGFTPVRNRHMGYTFRFFRAEGVMPWKESSVMEERLRFVARLLAMTEVCRDFGISRKTGYKTFDRYKEHGLEALSDRCRRRRLARPHREKRGARPGRCNQRLIMPDLVAPGDRLDRHAVGSDLGAC